MQTKSRLRKNNYTSKNHQLKQKKHQKQMNTDIFRRNHYQIKSKKLPHHQINRQYQQTAENFNQDSYSKNNHQKKTLSPVKPKGKKYNNPKPQLKGKMQFKNTFISSKNQAQKKAQSQQQLLLINYSFSRNSHILEEEKENERERLSHEIKNDSSQLVKKCNQLELENITLNKQLSLASSSLSKMNSSKYLIENQQLKQELTKIRKDNAFLKKRNISLQTENLKMKEKKTNSKAKEYNKLDKEINEMRSEALVLQMQLENLRQVYQSQQAQIEYQNQQIQYMDSQRFGGVGGGHHDRYQSDDFGSEFMIPPEFQEHSGNEQHINPDNMTYEELIYLQEQMGNVNVGLTAKELRKIPELLYGKATKIKKDDKCSICFNNYKFGTKIKKLKCKHFYHTKCISQWLKQKKKCPVCNVEVNVLKK